MTSAELLALLPLFLAALVPATLFVSAFLVGRQRFRILTVAPKVTTAAVVLTYTAVLLRPLLSLFGFDARTRVPTSVMNDVIQLDLETSTKNKQNATHAHDNERYARTYLAGQRELDRFSRSLL